MDNVLKRLLISMLVIVMSINISYAVEITITSSYGLENALYAFYIIAMACLWYFVFTRTKPMKLDEKKMLKSLFSSSIRLLCYAWFAVLFYMSRAILFISSSENFLDSKMFMFNLMTYVTIFVLVIFIIVKAVKFYGESTGVVDFIQKVAYEVRFGDE